MWRRRGEGEVGNKTVKALAVCWVNFTMALLSTNPFRLSDEQPR
jgi:hypothetical protein